VEVDETRGLKLKGDRKRRGVKGRSRENSTSALRKIRRRGKKSSKRCGLRGLIIAKTGGGRPGDRKENEKKGGGGEEGRWKSVFQQRKTFTR